MRWGCVALWLCACHHTPVADGGFVQVTVIAQTSGAQITRVSVTVTPANVPVDLTPDTGGTFSGTLSAPAGSQTVTATVFAGTTQVGSGSGSTVVVAGQTVPLSITVSDGTGPAPGPDHSPAITALTQSSGSVLLGGQVSLSATAVDADNDAITYAWSAAPTGCGTFTAPASASTTLTATAVGTCTVTITATAKGKSDSKSASIQVSAQPGTPALVQHLASSSNPRGIGNPGNNYRFFLPNPVRPGNCLILGITYPRSTTRTVSITDTAGNDWTGTLAVRASDPSTPVTSDIYVLPGAMAGVTQITVGFDTDLDSFQYTASEFNNVALSAPVSGSSKTTAAAAINGVATLSSGSFTPANNDANGGSLIWSYFANNSFGKGHPTDFTAGSGFTSLHSDIGWAHNQGMATASEYTIQTTAASINPGIQVTSTAGDTYNALSVALKASVAGTPPPPQGIRIVRQNISSLNNFQGIRDWVIQFPSVGNLLVITTPQQNVMPTTSVTDSKNNTWVAYVPDDEDPQIWYAANATPDPSLKVTFHMSRAPGGAQSALMYDIVNAASGGPDSVAERLNGPVTGTHIVESPVITPGSPNGLTIAAITLGQGPIQQLDTGSPAGAIFDYVYYDEEIDTDLMDNADGRAHYYNGSDMTPEHWNWLFVGPIANNNSAATAVHFKTAP